MRDDVGSGLLTAKNDPSAHSPFQDALLEETAKLGVVRARFDGFARHTFDELIEGYSSMKVLTYSSSIPIINRTAGELEKLEVVFGRSDILGDMSSYFYFQELLLKELIEATRGQDHIKEKIESGSVKLYVVQEIISHEKLFLLEGERGIRVITGSANFSDRAFSGAQNESYICFDDDPAAWEHFNRAFEKIRDRSTTSIIERAQIDGEFDAENLPALSPARKDSQSPRVVLVQDGPPEPSIVHKAVSRKPPKRFAGISSAVETKRGVAKIDRTVAQCAVRYVRMREYPPVVLSMNAGQDTFGSEIRKRALIVYTGASLPDHTGEARRLGRRVKQIKNNLGTALYREYLRRMLPRLRQEREDPLDVLELSSSVLREIISEHAGAPLPDWCRIVTMDEYGSSRHDRVREELLQQ